MLTLYFQCLGGEDQLYEHLGESGRSPKVLNDQYLFSTTTTPPSTPLHLQVRFNRQLAKGRQLLTAGTNVTLLSFCVATSVAMCWKTAKFTPVNTSDLSVRRNQGIWVTMSDTQSAQKNQFVQTSFAHSLLIHTAKDSDLKWKIDPFMMNRFWLGFTIKRILKGETYIFSQLWFVHFAGEGWVTFSFAGIRCFSTESNTVYSHKLGQL